jgi:hypothetical protein
MENSDTKIRAGLKLFKFSYPVHSARHQPINRNTWETCSSLASVAWDGPKAVQRVVLLQLLKVREAICNVPPCNSFG